MILYRTAAYRQNKNDARTAYRFRDSSVGIATRYVLAGFRVPVGVRFSAPDRTGSGANPASYTMGTGSSPGVKRPGRGIHHPPPSTAEVKERVPS